MSAERSSARAPSQWTVFGIVAVGVLMATIDSSIVNVSLPVVARHFGVPLGGEVEWVVIAYLVVVAALLLTAGRIADVFGRKGAWGWGLAAFTTGSALCGASPSLGALIGFRALQGVGAALLMAVSPAMIVGAFPGAQRGRALGLNAVVVGVGISLGPTLGGVITEHLGWRWIFYVNLPLGIAGIAAALRFLAPGPRAARARIDAPGALLLAVGLSVLTGALSFGQALGWGSVPVVAGLTAAAAALAALVARVRKAPDPLIDPKLFANRVFVSASVSLLLSFVATFAVSFLMAFYFEQLRGWPAERAGLLLTPLPLTVAVVSPASGAWADRIGTQKLAAGGMLVVAVGLATLTTLGAATGTATIVLALIVVGVGQATFRPPNNSALMGAAPADRQGVAAGVLATGRVVGQSLSIAFAGALFAGGGGGHAASLFRSHGRVAGGAAQVFLRGMRTALWGCAAVALAASLVALVRGRDGSGGSRPTT